MNVILDTNIFVNDFMMRSKNFIVFLEYSKKMPFDIFVPELVLDEVINKYQEKLGEVVSTYNKSVRDMGRIILDGLKFTNIDIEEEVKKYRGYLEEKFKYYRIKSITYPKVNHKEIVKYALSRKKPFKKNGSGYRDKLILESIFERFDVLSETTVFISSNSNDFGSEPDFSKDIIEECKSYNRWHLKINNSLNSFNEKYIKSLIPVDNTSHSIKEFDGYFGESFGEWLLKNLGDIIYDGELGHDLLDLEREYGSVMLSKVDNVRSIDVSNVLEFSDDYITFEVNIDLCLILYISADVSDMLESESWADFFDYSASEGYVDISTWQQVKAKLSFEVVIDSRSKDIITNKMRRASTDYADLWFV